MLVRLDWTSGYGNFLIFLGYYIDRGRQSYEVVETVAKLIGRSLNGILSWVTIDNIFKLHRRPDNALFFANDLAAIIRDYTRPSNEIFAAHLNGYCNFIFYYRTSDYIFIHTGLAFGRSLAGQNHQDILWICDKFL